MLWHLIFDLLFIAITLHKQIVIMIMSLLHHRKSSWLVDQPLFDELNRLTGLTIKRIKLFDHPKAQAFAFSLFFIKRISISTPIREQLSHDEQLAILLHEIGHIKLHHVIKRLSQVFLLLLAAHISLNLFQGIRFYIAFTVILLITALASLSIFRRHERQADAYAIEHCGTLAPLTSALTKIAKINQMPLTRSRLAQLFQQHDSIAQRCQS